MKPRVALCLAALYLLAMLVVDALVYIKEAHGGR